MAKEILRCRTEKNAKTMNTDRTSMSKIKAYFRAQNIEFSAKRIFIDGLGGMAYGLFASLLIGTIISTVGTF